MSYLLIIEFSFFIMNLGGYMKNLHINEEGLSKLSQEKLNISREDSKKMTGFASLDKPWMKWHGEGKDKLEIPNDNFYDYFMNMTKEYPSDTVLLDFMGQVGYTREEIEKKVMDNIKMFANLGVKAGDTVSFMMLNVPEVIFMFLALNKMGAISNLIKFDESPERINFMLNLTNSKYFFISEIPPIIENVLKTVGLSNKLEKVISVPVLESIQKDSVVTPNELGLPKFMSYHDFKKTYLKDTEVKLAEKGQEKSALIVYTGGSTGDAKGVELTNKNLVAMAHGLKNSGFGFTYGKTSMNILPPAIAYYLNATCGLMICGVKTTLIPSFDIQTYPNLIDTYKPNIIFSGPILLKALQYSDIKDFSYLTNPASGGDKLLVSEEEEINEELIKRGGGSVQQGYGASEETAVATCNLEKERRVGSIGVPMSNVTISIFEYQSDKELEYGMDKEGEICITGPTVMKGYLNNQEATNYVLKRHSDGRIWAHTDDFGVMDEDGFLYHRGRAKRMLTRSGTKLWLPALEEEIQKLDFVLDCCAVKFDDLNEREVPVIHLVLKETELSEEELIDLIDKFILENSPSYYLPKYYVIKENLPYSEVNKKKDFKTLEKEDILDSTNFTLNSRIIRPITKVKKLNI